MAGRGWDDPWTRYPASVPLPVEGGLATSRQRGAMAGTWWSKRFVQVLESYGLGTRMQRGRRYARQGQVLHLDVRSATIAAQVQGSRRTPYLVTIALPEPAPAQWAAIDAAMRAKVGFVARLLAGEVPEDLEGVFADAGVALFPQAWRVVRAGCSCPDWENPCKHIAAVLYVFADQLDTDPWLLLAWRGRTRDEVLASLRGAASAAGAEAAAAVAPWWPFAGVDFTAARALPVATRAVQLVDPERPDAVLDGLEPLDVTVAGAPLRERIRSAYDRLVEAPVEPPATDPSTRTGLRAPSRPRGRP